MADAIPEFRWRMGRAHGEHVGDRELIGDCLVAWVNGLPLMVGLEGDRCYPCAVVARRRRGWGLPARRVTLVRVQGHFDEAGRMRLAEQACWTMTMKALSLRGRDYVGPYQDGPEGVARFLMDFDVAASMAAATEIRARRERFGPDAGFHRSQMRIVLPQTTNTPSVRLLQGSFLTEAGAAR